MTMTAGKTTGPEAAAPAIKAAREMHAKYVAAGDDKAAKLVAAVSNLFANITFPEAKAEVPEKAKVDSAEIEGTSIDLTGMSTSDAAAYAEYVAELDGSARRERHVEQMERDDEETRALFGARDGS